MSTTVDEIVAGLRTQTVDLPALVDSTLPSAGFYAWWEIGEALPGVPAVTHPDEPELALIYVGIGPASATSNETLRSRLVGKHLDGNTGSSTLRLTLAAHLMELLGLRPRATAKKVVLNPADNRALSEWMHRRLRVTWATCGAPWEIESVVIRTVRPPLNIDHNRDHPYCLTNRDLRAKFRSQARST